MKNIFLSSLILLFSACALNGNSSQVEVKSNVNDSTDPQTVTTQKVEKISSTPLTLAFVGDMMMGTTYPEKGNYLPPNDGADLFVDAKPILSGVDIAAGNLEGTLLDKGGEVKRCSNPSLCYAFRMPTRYVNHLKDAGFDFVGIANNHINDFGATGLKSTQETLKNNEILFAGLRATCPVAYTEVDGKKIGFAAFGHNKGTLSIMDMDEVKKTVGDLAKECDIVVVSFHGGGEGKDYQHVPHKMETCFGENRGNVEAFAHAAIDAGADIVYGHGPHVPRAMELYNDHLIMYSLGNFCTPYRMGLSGVSGHSPIVTVTLNPDGTFESGQIHSLIQKEGVGPRLDKTNSVAQNIKKLSASDFPNSPLKIADDGSLSK